MIRNFQQNDLPRVMKIWLETNLQAHGFIPKEYWLGNVQLVQELLPQAELYVHEDEATKNIDGFIGLSEDYIEGIFVAQGAQSRGIGKQLLDHVKSLRPALSLSVYKKNEGALRFYRREQFQVRSEGVDEQNGEAELTLVWRR